MRTRFSVVLSGFVCAAAGLSCSGLPASDERLDNVESARAPTQEIPAHEIPGGFPPLSPPFPMAPVELALTPLPPGTLGQTYTRPSHPIPIDEHPRTAMLAVRDRGKVPYLSVLTMGGVKMKSGIWLFESTRPLDPGACQIVRVEARETPQDIEPYSTKFVRLIPGRIVYLDF